MRFECFGLTLIVDTVMVETVSVRYENRILKKCLFQLKINMENKNKVKFSVTTDERILSNVETIVQLKKRGINVCKDKG